MAAHNRPPFRHGTGSGFPAPLHIPPLRQLTGNPTHSNISILVPNDCKGELDPNGNGIIISKRNWKIHAQVVNTPGTQTQDPMDIPVVACTMIPMHAYNMFVNQVHGQGSNWNAIGNRQEVPPPPQPHLSPEPVIVSTIDLPIPPQTPIPDLPISSHSQIPRYLPILQQSPISDFRAMPPIAKPRYSFKCPLTGQWYAIYRSSDCPEYFCIEDGNDSE